MMTRVLLKFAITCIVLSLVCLVSSCRKDEPVYAIKDAAAGPVKLPFDSTFSMVMYPNPFNETLAFDFRLADTRSISWIIVDAMGRTVFKEDGGTQPPGAYHLAPQLQSLQPGIYFFIFQFGNVRIVRRGIKIA